MRKPTFLTAVPIIIACTIALVGTGCATPDENDTRSATQGLPDTQQSLEANTWALVGAESKPPVNSSNPVTLEFDDDVLTGKGPCNSYGGTFSLDDHDLTVDNLTQSEMACQDSSDNDAEQAYLAALSSAESVDTTDRDRLVIQTADGELVFRVADRVAE